MAAFGLHAEDIIALQDFSLRVGGTEKATVTLSTDVENYRGFQADVILPIGVAITSVSDAGRGVETEDVNIQKTVGKAVAQEDGLTQKQTVVFALDCNLRAGEGELLKLTLAADASMAAGRYEGTLQNVILSYSTGSTVSRGDVNFTFEVYNGNARIILDENSTEIPEATDDVVDVTVRRTIHANEWSTICLPFAMTGAQVVEAFGNDAQLAVFSDWESEEDDDENIVGINISFGSVDPSNGIEANKPLLIYVSSPITEFTADNVIIDPEEEPSVMIKHGTKKRDPESYMIGTYQAETLLENFSLFLYGNKFYYSVGKTKMQAYRAFFNIYDILSDVENAYADVKMAIDINGIADSVEGLNNDQGARDSECYDLSGRHISTPQQRGVYVVNGHKVLVR